MTLSSVFASDGRALSDALDAGRGPIVVLDPCGELWAQFWQESRWRLWRAWRFSPGHVERYDCWDVLAELQSVNPRAGATVLASALFPLTDDAELTRRLMGLVLAFADDTGHFNGLASLAGQLWADDLWPALTRWSRLFPHHPMLQMARALLTQEGAGTAVLTIRNRMATYHHPHVAETFQAGVGFRITTLGLQLGQIIFLTPGIRCLENPELMAVYAFIIESLLQLSALHHKPFTLFQPAHIFEGDAS